VEALLASADISEADYVRKENFWRAAISVCQAGSLLGRRYADRARDLAAEATDERERERLLAIAETCDRAPARGAQTFHEAVQALWFTQVLTCAEDGINANSIGRLDQTLWPYYEADVSAGRLTRDEAREVMQELACKLHRDYNVQNIVLGGVDAEGRSAVNELTYVILDATQDVGLIRPLCLAGPRQPGQAGGAGG